MDVDILSPFALFTFSFVEYGCPSKPVGRGDAIARSRRLMVWPKMAMMWIVTASEVRRGRQTDAELSRGALALGAKRGGLWAGTPA